jgi:HK97 family phage prohead protease
LCDAADYVGLPVFLTFAHDDQLEIADQRDGSLSLWADDHGLAFSAKVPSTWRGLGLVRSVRGGNFREMSCCWDGDRWSDFVEEPGFGQVETVKRARLIEVSIVPATACPGTGVWLDSEAEAELPDHLRTLRAMWRLGRVQGPLARQRRRARDRAIVDRMLARSGLG